MVETQHLKPKIPFPPNPHGRQEHNDPNLIESHSLLLGQYKIIYERKYETTLSYKIKGLSKTGNIIESLAVTTFFGSDKGNSLTYNDSLISIKRIFNPKDTGNEQIKINYNVCSENENDLFDTVTYYQDGRYRSYQYYPGTIRPGNINETRSLSYLKELAKKAGFLSKSDLPEKVVDVIKVAEKVRKACEDAVGANDPKLLLAGILPTVS